MNLSTCFLLPLLGEVEEDDFNKLNIEIYTGKDTDEWGEYLFIHSNKVEDNILYKRIQDNSLSHYEVSADRIGYLWELTDTEKEQVVRPFLEGKYSLIDREYVTNNFPEKEFIGFDVFGKPQYKTLTNWKILTKSPELRSWQEERLGVSLPEDAEVWAKPEKKEEIFNYVEKNPGEKPEPPTASSSKGTQS